jgi:hypothetical protein
MCGDKQRGPKTTTDNLSFIYSKIQSHFGLSFINHTDEAEGISAQSPYLPRDLQDEALNLTAFKYSEQPFLSQNRKHDTNTKPVEWSGTSSLVPPPGLETTKDEGITSDQLLDDIIGYVSSLGTLFLAVLLEYILYDRVPQTRVH